MADMEKSSNDKLFDDIEFTRQLIENDRTLGKKEPEDSKSSWLPKKFHNSSNDNQKRKLTKRYKTPWEAGEGKMKNEYEGKRSQNYNNLSSKNQNTSFKDSSENLSEIRENNSPYKSRKDGFFRKNHYEGDKSKTRKNWERYPNQSTNWKWRKDNRYNDMNKTTFTPKDKIKSENVGKEAFQKPQKDRRVKYKRGDTDELDWEQDNMNDTEANDKYGNSENTNKIKHVKWKSDSQYKTRGSEGNYQYENKKRDGNYEKFTNSRKTYNAQSPNRNRKWSKDRDSREPNRYGAGSKTTYKEEKPFKKRWNNKDTKPTTWNRRSRDQSPYEKRNTNYAKQRDWSSENKKEDKEIESHDSEQQKTPSEYKKQGLQNDFHKRPYNSGYSKHNDKQQSFRTKSSSHETRPMSMIKRREWGAPKTKWGIGPPIKLPIKYVFCLPTYRNRCFNLKQCTKELLFLHERHTSTKTCPDVKYSFFIGTNGNVYECRGWKTRPGLPKKFEKINKSSLFIALAGKFNRYNIPDKMINARDYVIQYGLKHALIDKDYIIRSAVDFANIKSSEDDNDQQGSDEETQNQETEDQETGDHEAQDHKTKDHGTEDEQTEDRGSEDQETEDQETEDRGTEDRGSEDQETENQETEDQESEEQGSDDEQEIGSNWEDEFKDITSVSGSSVKSWESYNSSWEISGGDFTDVTEGSISGEEIE